MKRPGWRDCDITPFTHRFAPNLRKRTTIVVRKVRDMAIIITALSIGTRHFDLIVAVKVV